MISIESLVSFRFRIKVEMRLVFPTSWLILLIKSKAQNSSTRKTTLHMQMWRYKDGFNGKKQIQRAFERMLRER